LVGFEQVELERKAEMEVLYPRMKKAVEMSSTLNHRESSTRVGMEEVKNENVFLIDELGGYHMGKDPHL